ncbi:uncharacterized protein LOC131316246 isoform X2 [Rhododendron vialii]|uniref:uncharacterized protein LOC131316246 isoform X2 n=1 Tax=Rhododendron vialii TaxID=182163 RepID=UPI00265E714D|nr:uncharacterized protein LOC131316246 isoform X2 [Rhododendron vialii]
MAEIQIMEYVVVKYRRNFLGLFIRLQSLPGGKEEHLIDLGFECRGGIAKARWSCIDTWFHIRGSNKYEVCQQVAINVPPLASQPSALILHLLEQTFRMEVICTSYLVWRVDPTFTGSTIAEECERGCFSPLWVAFSILVGGLLLDVPISITLGVSALRITSIIGVTILLVFGTAVRLGVEFCRQWRARRAVHTAQNK